LPHIFERFYHGKNSSADSVGIGLALSKSILNNQNASITVESEEGSGTRFIIKFYKVIV
jgi:signal transduction histidine kinase